jgi:hypothetical protein
MAVSVTSPCLYIDMMADSVAIMAQVDVSENIELLTFVFAW